MNYKEEVLNKLKQFKKEDIIISTHALIRLKQRQISEAEIIENIINPRRLQYAVKQKANNLAEEKFDCYFGYSKTQCHRYIIIIKNKIIVVTVIKINKRWQRIVEKKINRD
ncbi:DUF4258 domain-containing protein [Candidatus Woesearchaeota archaeon]|nr:DUF4258 domain-containing protein [Candidatus Woesearchaeota archaeon]